MTAPTKSTLHLVFTRDDICSVTDCPQEVSAKGFCAAHYNRWWRTGNPLPKPKPSRADRFWAKVEKGEGCWVWSASLTHDGYGCFRGENGMTLAHRFSYILANGPVPDGFQIDHLCRNRRCVRPDHLESVTPRENAMRSNSSGALAVRTGKCVRGHDLSGARVVVTAEGRVERHCRECRRERRRERKSSN